jgi:hypothetical protein
MFIIKIVNYNNYLINVMKIIGLAMADLTLSQH